MAIKIKKPQVKLIGNNATNVTGSMSLVTTAKGTQILLECGIIQGEGTMEDDFRLNANSMNKIDLEKIKYCFILHSHADHLLATPRAIAQGMKAKIIMTPITAKIGRELCLDGAFINQRNADYLSEKYKKPINPLSTQDNVLDMLNYICEYGYDEIHELDDEISFRLLRNNHVLGASSLELFIKDDSGKKFKLFYSSDLGNVAISDRHYTDKLEYCKNANLCLFESTYGDKDTYFTKKDRKKEINYLRDKIIEHCLGQKGNVILPCFSYARSQEIMTILYELFKNDERFEHIDFVVDSKLTRNIIKVYSEVLNGDENDLFNEVINWKNFKIISDFKTETEPAIKDSRPKVIISSSGFCEQGHVKEYIKHCINHPKNAIIFVGFASQESLAGRIRSDSESVTIDGKEHWKNMKVYSLLTFSSHMQKKDLVNYICGVNTEKVVLIHGSQNAKQELKKACDIKLSEMNKTTNVIVGEKNMTISF